MLLALPPASREFVICARRQPVITAAPTSSWASLLPVASFPATRLSTSSWERISKRPFVATYWSLCTLMSSRGTNFCAKERCRASVKRQGCLLINYTSLLCGASMAITCQQFSCSHDGKSRCDPFPLKQLLNCISVKIPGACSDCAQGRDFVLKAPSQNSSDQENLLRYNEEESHQCRVWCIRREGCIRAAPSPPSERKAHEPTVRFRY